MNPVQDLIGIETLAERYPVWMCDIWGVVHDGVIGFEAAVDALTRYRQQGGVVALITNSPRPGPQVALQLDGLGVPAEAYDAIVSSGDVTRALILEYQTEIIFHLGPERDQPLFEGLDIELGDIDDAGCILCTGLFDDEAEAPEDYHDMLEFAATRQLVMLCANPDKVVQKGDKLIHCAGALAGIYQQLGGEVLFAGKPYRPIYDEALKQLEEFCGLVPQAKDILAIGDGTLTDLAGAAACGFDTLFIMGGIHAGEIDHADGNKKTRDEFLLELKQQLPDLQLIATQTALCW